MGAPTIEQVIHSINANTLRVRQLETNGATVSVPGVPSLQASIAMEPALRFRLRAGTGITGSELDLGSNDEYFWLWAKRNEPPAVFYGRHLDYQRMPPNPVLPVPPSWLIEALGLVRLDPALPYEGPIVRAG